MKVKNCTDQEITIGLNVGENTWEPLDLKPGQIAFLPEGYYPEGFQNLESWHIGMPGRWALHEDEDDYLFYITLPSDEELRELERLEKELERKKWEILGYGI